jgi:plasmid maintenance system antidote protein VapI
VRWKARFGADVAMELIRHEEAHLTAFKELAEAEGFTEEVCLRFGETFDASMTEEAWARLKSNYDAMREDQGEDNEIFRSLRVIEDAKEAEEFSQMKGALKCIVHPTGQM